jgi:hypothetical protein
MWEPRHPSLKVVWYSVCPRRRTLSPGRKALGSRDHAKRGSRFLSLLNRGRLKGVWGLGLLQTSRVNGLSVAAGRREEGLFFNRATLGYGVLCGLLPRLFLSEDTKRLGNNQQLTGFTGVCRRSSLGFECRMILGPRNGFESCWPFPLRGGPTRLSA